MNSSAFGDSGDDFNVLEREADESRVLLRVDSSGFLFAQPCGTNSSAVAESDVDFNGLLFAQPFGKDSSAVGEGFNDFSALGK